MTDDTRDDTRDAERGSPHEEPKTPGLFEGVARAIGRTAGRTRDALTRLGERGALAVALRRLEHERSSKLEEFGRIARKALAAPDGLLRRDDPRAAEIARALDRLDEKLARMRERLDKSGGEADEKSDKESDQNPDAATDGPRKE